MALASLEHETCGFLAELADKMIVGDLALFGLIAICVIDGFGYCLGKGPRTVNSFGSKTDNLWRSKRGHKITRCV